MPEATFRSFLARSLEAIAAEAPAAYAAVCAQLGRRQVALEIDAERVGIRGDGRELRLGDPPARPAVEFACERDALLDLTGGRLSFLDGALAGRIRVRGAADDVAVFYEALLRYLQGAVRSPSLPGLLDEFIAGGEAR